MVGLILLGSCWVLVLKRRDKCIAWVAFGCFCWAYDEGWVGLGYCDDLDILVALDLDGCDGVFVSWSLICRIRFFLV